MNTPSHAFYEFNVETGESRRLTPPDQPFKIASGDWSLSPDGNKIVFANAADNNIWVWQFDE
jgi:Tol biopolymer transport system component